MSTDYRDEVIAVLEAGRQDVISSASGLTEEQATLKPAPNRWSVLECLEHLTVVEARFLTWLDEAKPRDAIQDGGIKRAELKAMMEDRATLREAPEAVLPTGRFPTIAVALEQFHTIRNRTVQIAEQRAQELQGVGVEHPRFGAMTGLEVLHLAAGHASRHAAQMREVRLTLGF